MRLDIFVSDICHNCTNSFSVCVLVWTLKRRIRGPFCSLCSMNVLGISILKCISWLWIRVRMHSLGEERIAIILRSERTVLIILYQRTVWSYYIKVVWIILYRRTVWIILYQSCKDHIIFFVQLLWIIHEVHTNVHISQDKLLCILAPSLLLCMCMDVLCIHDLDTYKLSPARSM